MMVARKKKPKPAITHKPLLPALASGMASVMGTIYGLATPENIQWLTSHGGRLFSIVAAGLAIANCVRTWKITNADKK